MTALSAEDVGSLLIAFGVFLVILCLVRCKIFHDRQRGSLYGSQEEEYGGGGTLQPIFHQEEGEDGESNTPWSPRVYEELFSKSGIYLSAKEQGGGGGEEEDVSSPLMQEEEGEDTTPSPDTNPCLSSLERNGSQSD